MSLTNRSRYGVVIIDTREWGSALLLLFSKLAARRPKHTQILALAPTTTSNFGLQYLSNGGSYDLKPDRFGLPSSAQGMVPRIPR